VNVIGFLKLQLCAVHLIVNNLKTAKMKVTSKKNAARMLHIITGSTIAIYIYSPLAENVLFQNVIKFIVIPLTAISGLWLWKGHYFKSFLTKKKNIPFSFFMLFV